MSMKKRVILMASGVVVLIALLIIVIAHNKQEEANQEPSSSSQIVYDNLLENDRENIASITLTTAEDEITFIPGEHSLDGSLKWMLKDHEDWTLSYNYQQVVSMATTFQAYKLIEENVTDPSRLAEFGLKDPVSVITILLKDGTIQQVHIGNRSTDNSYAFCQLVGDDTVYACNSSYWSYATYTRQTIRLATIESIDTEGEVVSFYAHQNGEREIKIFLDDDYEMDIKSGEAIYISSPYQFEEPYHADHIKVMHGIETEYFAKLETPSIVYTIDADCQDLSEYGLADDNYVFRETMVTRSGQEGDYTYHTTDYVFGYPFGNDNEFIYFREGDSNMVLGVDIACMQTRTFKPMDYVNKLIFLNPITDVNSGTIDYNGRVYEFEAEREEVQGDSYVDMSDRLSVYYVNGTLVEEYHFSSLYRALIELAPDYEIMGETPAYDANDYLTYTFNQVDGSVETVTLYRLNEFYYVTQMEDDLWFSVAAADVENVVSKFDDIDKDIEIYGNQ